MKSEILKFAAEHETFFAIDVQRALHTFNREKIFSLLRGLCNEGILEKEYAIDHRSRNMGWKYKLAVRS